MTQRHSLRVRQKLMLLKTISLPTLSSEFRFSEDQQPTRNAKEPVNPEAAKQGKPSRRPPSASRALSQVVTHGRAGQSGLDGQRSQPTSLHRGGRARAATAVTSTIYQHGSYGGPCSQVPALVRVPGLTLTHTETHPKSEVIGIGQHPRCHQGMPPPEAQGRS